MKNFFSNRLGYEDLAVWLDYAKKTNIAVKYYYIFNRAHEEPAIWPDEAMEEIIAKLGDDSYFRRKQIENTQKVHSTK